MTEQPIATHGATDDVGGRRRIVDSVARAKTFGASSFSGLLDIVGGVTVLSSFVAAGVMAAKVADGEDSATVWLDEYLVLVLGVTAGLLLMALSRLVLYGKACAVLLAKSTDDRNRRGSTT